MSTTPLPHTPSLFSLRSQGETTPSLPAGFRNLALKDSMSSSRAVRPDIPNQFHQSGRTSGRKRPIHRTIWLHWLQTERSISGAGSKVCRPVKSHPPSSRNPGFPLSSWCMDISSSPAIHETPLQRSPKSPRNIAKNQ